MPDWREGSACSRADRHCRRLRANLCFLPPAQSPQLAITEDPDTFREQAAVVMSRELCSTALLAVLCPLALPCWLL